MRGYYEQTPHFYRQHYPQLSVACPARS